MDQNRYEPIPPYWAALIRDCMWRGVKIDSLIQLGIFYERMLFCHLLEDRTNEEELEQMLGRVEQALKDGYKSVSVYAAKDRDDTEARTYVAVILENGRGEWFAMNPGIKHSSDYKTCYKLLLKLAKERTQPWSYDGRGPSIHMWSTISLFLASMTVLGWLHFFGGGVTELHAKIAALLLSVLLIAMFVPPLLLGSRWRKRASRIESNLRTFLAEELAPA